MKSPCTYIFYQAGFTVNISFFSYFQFRSNPYACACGYALCKNCLYSETRLLHDSTECDLLKVIMDDLKIDLIADFDPTKQLPTRVHEPIAALRLLRTKWYVVYVGILFVFMDLIFKIDYLNLFSGQIHCCMLISLL